MSAKILVICISLLVALAAGLNTIADRESIVTGLSLLLGIVILAPAFVASIRRSFDPIEPIYFWLPLYAYMYLIKPVARIAFGDRFWFGEQNLEWAMSVAIIGLLAFYIGYYCRLGPDIAHHVPLLGGEVSQRRVRICAWTFIIIGAAGLWAYMEASGGWREFWSLPHGYGGKAELSTAYIYQLPELMVVGFFLILYDAMMGEVDMRAVGRIGVASIGGLGIYAILWSRRTLIAWTLLTTFILWSLRRGRYLSLASIVLFGLTIFVSISLALAYRPYLHLGVNPADFAKAAPVETALEAISRPGDEFDSFLAIVSLYPDRINYDHFQIYARIFIHPIPRLVWPDKPPLFVSSWDDFLFQSGISWGASESVLGDLYIQLGLVGVIIGMFMSGVLWKFLFAYLQQAPSSGLMPLLYAVTLGNVPSFIMQSGISAFWKWMPFMIPGVVIAYWVTKRKTPGQTEAWVAWTVHSTDG